MIPLLIDADPGVDDALALLMAFADPDHELLALTVTAGNVGLNHTLANALKLTELFAPGLPVHAGAASPLVHASPWNAAAIHGADGFGDTGYEPAVTAPAAEHAALAMLRHSHEQAGRLLLVAMGPLTNLALAVKLDPSLPERVARLVVMGGAVNGPGNITPAAEFNVAFDPEAAHIVFESFPRVELVDWGATLAHGLPHADFDEWLTVGTERARFYDAISRRTRRWSADSVGPVWYSADALAMAWALQPAGAVRFEDRPVRMELTGTVARGATVVDWKRQTGAADNARILLEFERERFHSLVRQALGAAPSGAVS